MRIKTFLTTLLLGGSVALLPTAHAQEHHKTSPDATFAKKAAIGGLTEVALGDLATKNGDSQDVKDFGAKMVTDHGKINDNLKAIATKDNLTLPDKPDDDHQAVIDKLSKKTGKAFDTAYIQAMVKAHIGDKAAFTAENENTANADLKQFTSDSLTVIKEHLGMIEDIASTHGLGSGKHKSSGTAMGNMSGDKMNAGGNTNLPPVGSNDTGINPEGPTTTSPSTPATSGTSGAMPNDMR